ncbi:2-hydroxyacid dehydrogenase [Halovulum sp. GXIMD14793]
MLNILFSARPGTWDDYAETLPKALQEAGVEANILLECDAPETIDYVVYAPSGGLADFTPFTNCRAVLSLWAGVERIVTNDSLTQPLCRMVDPGLEEGMRDWVTAHVLRHHLNIDADILNQDGIWRQQPLSPLARNRRVGILGLGALGTCCSTALAGLGFEVSGWSRRPHQIDGVDCLSGSEGLEAILRSSEILVLLLPLTPETWNLLDTDRLALMPKGAVIINPGRGPLIDDEALVTALDSGALGHATLDVFREEPLPSAHPFWAHSKVTVTPHIASATRPDTAAQVVARNIARDQRGLPLLHVVDRERGY